MKWHPETWRTRTRRLAACALALSTAAAGARADDSRPSLDDFAYSIEMMPRRESAVHTARVPLDVYRGAVRSDLGDVRVFEAGGAEVAHAIRTLDQGKELTRTKHALPIFPLYRSAGSATIDSLALRVERDASGTVVDIRAEGDEARRPGEAKSAAIDAYVVDASSVDDTIVALDFGLEPAPADYVLPLVVESSQDLSTFHRVSTNQALVDLVHAGKHLERKRLELRVPGGGFLRIRWPGHELPAAVASLQAELGARRQRVEQPAWRVQGVQRAGQPGTYDFDLGGPLPVDRARLELPSDNLLIYARLGSRARLDAEPQVVQEGVFYRIRRGDQRVNGDAIHLVRRRERYWTLEVDAKGGGLGPTPPALELARYVDQLLFLDSGSPPFQLAYGHHAAEPTSFAPDELLQTLSSSERRRLPTSDTELAEQPTARAGEAARTPPPPPPPYLQYLLWAVLIGGVLLLLSAAVRLFRTAS